MHIITRVTYYENDPVILQLAAVKDDYIRHKMAKVHNKFDKNRSIIFTKNLTFCERSSIVNLRAYAP